MPYLIRNPETPDETLFELQLGSNTIGREPGNQILIEGDEKGISRRHAKIFVTPESVLVEDLFSRNGTFINETRIKKSQLIEGDLVRFGNVVFKFVQILQDQTQPPTADLSILGRFFPEQTRVVMQDLLKENQDSILQLRQQSNEQRAVDKFKILLEVSQQLSSPEELDQLPHKILDLLFTIMKVDRAVILLRDQETQQLEPVAFKTRQDIPLDSQFYSKRIVDYVCENSEAILTADAFADDRFQGSESIVRQAIHASMCVPLKPRDTILGVLYVDNLSLSNLYTQEDLEFLTGLANQAAIAIDNANLYQRIQAEAVMRVKLERFFPPAVTQKIKEEGDLKMIETEVTALFSDISGFTELSSRMEPYQVLELLNEYFKVMVEEIVFRYEGTLEKYIADALLAVWGSPYQQRNDAQRAVRAAIEMQWAMRQLNQQWNRQQRDLEIQIHIGLNSGKVAAGNIGSKKLIQYANIGDSMNVASRVCSTARAGEILISQTTLEKLDGFKLPLEALPPVLVKGKEEPLTLYRVLWAEVQPDSYH